jgi:hypothetical protein
MQEMHQGVGGATFQQSSLIAKFWMPNIGGAKFYINI